MASALLISALQYAGDFGWPYLPTFAYVARCLRTLRPTPAWQSRFHMVALAPTVANVAHRGPSVRLGAKLRDEATSMARGRACFRSVRSSLEGMAR
jgi:hypothetical protein